MNTPAKIIFVPFITAFGGAERLILDLSQYLHETGVPATIVCFKQTVDLTPYAGRPLEVHQLSPARNAIAEARALSAYLRSTRLAGGGLPLLFDLKSAFYSGLFSSGPFALHLTDPPSLLPADISKHARSARRSVPEFANLQGAGAIGGFRADMVHRLNRRGVKRAERVIVMTEKIRLELQQLYDIDPVVIRPGVADVDSRRTSPPAGAKPLRLLSVSRLEPNKRIDWILRSLGDLQSSGNLKRSEWVFEIAGQGPAEQSLKELSQQLGLHEQVSFLGHLSDHELANAYSRANLFLMPAVQGYGLPALEALHRGLPAIVHKDSGVSEILGQSHWAEIIEGDNGSLAKAIGSMKDCLASDSITNANKPRIPTSSEWARQICEACGWLPASESSANDGRQPV